MPRYIKDKIGEIHQIRKVETFGDKIIKVLKVVAKSILGFIWIMFLIGLLTG
ncbi:hypothetical protein [Leisingera caerulea]|uniref:hypothetical protein n=1 Tax=Leisingera caerulea TaxID=506591 RepID=UPI0003F95143|nr:hypothetical protein [Leisingera caerulea]